MSLEESKVTEKNKMKAFSLNMDNLYPNCICFVNVRHFFPTFTKHLFPTCHSAVYVPYPLMSGKADGRQNRLVKLLYRLGQNLIFPKYSESDQAIGDDTDMRKNENLPHSNISSSFVSSK